MCPIPRATRAVASAAVATAGLLAVAAPAGAATLTVENASDAEPGSLRAAIISANSTAEPDTIRFADSVRGAIVLQGNPLTIASELTIEGPGARALRVSGGHLSRVFVVDAGATATIAGLTIADGAVFGGGNGGPAVASGGTGGAGESGGAGNVPGAPGAPGGSSSATGGAGSSQVGGGIENRGTLTLREVAVAGNQVRAGRGGNATATGGGGAKGGDGADGPNGGDGGKGGKGGDATATGGVGGNAQGGGVFNGGTLTIERSTISFNRVLGGTGGDSSATGGSGGLGGTGGDNSGGGDGAVGGEGGKASATGGKGGDAEGAGVFNAGTLTVRASTIASNVALPGLLGAAAGTGGSGGSGGSAGAGVGAGNGGSGGAGARADAFRGGRGLDHGGGLTTAETKGSTLAGVTLAGNDAAAGANVENRGEVVLQSSIVADPGGGGANCQGSVSSLGHNIESAATCGLGAQGDRTSTEPGLGSLRDNGGPTDTRAIAPGSPAHEAGVAAGSATDQRGVPRPSDDTFAPNAAGGDGSDVGAFEIPFVPDTTAPTIGSAKASPKTAKRTTTLVYTLSEAASVLHTIERALPGRSVGGKCRAPSASNRNAKRCTRFARAGTFTTQRPAGQNRQKLPSKVGGKKLGAGSYRATLVATDASSNRSSAKRISFRLTG